MILLSSRQAQVKYISKCGMTQPQSKPEEPAIYILPARSSMTHTSSPEPQTLGRKFMMVYEDWSGGVDIAGDWFLKEFGIQGPMDRP
jgi:hypothetical protein